MLYFISYCKIISFRKIGNPGTVAAVSRDRKKVGIGIKVRDHSSMIVGLSLKFIQGVYSSRTAEAMAVCEGLHDTQIGPPSILIESDAEVLVNSIQQKMACPLGIFRDTIYCSRL